MAARSVAITFVNQTNMTLYQGYWDLDHGIWNGGPPGSIAPGLQYKFENDSDGFMTGAEGKVCYACVNPDGTWNGQVRISWDDPFVGSDSFNGEAVFVNGATIKTNYSGGDNAAVTFTFASAS
jgi:hypothetical protein